MTEYVADAWSPIEYKFKGATDGRAFGVQSWVGDHVRRLMAYTVLQSYVDNTARQWLSPPDSLDEIAGRDPDDHREYGDPALIVKTILGGLLGNEQVINCDGAEVFDPREDAENSDDVLRAYELQTFLREWSEDVRFGLKMIDVERDAIGLGDGVYVLGWSDYQQRVWLNKYNPGFYFPVLDEEDMDPDYPSKVHIAWELPPDDMEPGVVKIRRMTYELVDLKDDEPSIRYPYKKRPSRKRCILSDGIWTLDSFTATVDDLTEQRVKWLKNDDGEIKRKLDLGIDFIPVVHIPNTVAEEDHFGRSSLAEVLQVLDDLAAADTDLQAASATTGTPVIALSGVNSGDVITSYGPGSVFEVGDGGMDMLDTSKALVALLSYVDKLLNRLAINSRVPEAALGRLNAAQVPSGIALALSFSPMEQMVKEMRQVRDEKYPLLLKFVLRLSMVGGVISTGPLPKARVAFGSFLPTDRNSLVQEVNTLLANNAISTRTAVLLLMNAGLPIDDAAKEVERITKEQTLKASQATQATGSYEAGRRLLGMEDLPPPVSPPGINGTLGEIGAPEGTPPGPVPRVETPPITPTGQ